MLRRFFRNLLFLAFLLPTLSAPAQTLDVTNGLIFWSSSNIAGMVSVEWATAKTGVWMNAWDATALHPVTASNMYARVPVFYRVVFNTTDWALVNFPFNGSDTNGYGQVNYGYCIGKYEVYNAQYTAFLNAVDPYGSNALGLYNSRMASDPRGGISFRTVRTNGTKYATRSRMGGKPVIFVSFWDACRYANWLHNGKGAEGSTETGAYNLPAVSPNNWNVSRSPGARFFIPNENEWYKAAYYDEESKKYWTYATRNDADPTPAEADEDGHIITNGPSVKTNIANYNFGADWNGLIGNLTAIGTGGEGSRSFYGAYDMTGNVDEWNESVVNSYFRCTRGGCWFSLPSFARKTFRWGFSPSNEFDSVGFRVAALVLRGSRVPFIPASYSNDDPPMPPSKSGLSDEERYRSLRRP